MEALGSTLQAVQAALRSSSANSSLQPLQALPRINTKPLQAAFKQTPTHPESPGKLSVVSYDLETEIHDVDRQLHSLLGSQAALSQATERMPKPVSSPPGSGSAAPQRLKFLLPSTSSSSNQRLLQDPERPEPSNNSSQKLAQDLDSPEAMQRPHSAVRFRLDSAALEPPPQPATFNQKPGLRINVSPDPKARRVSGSEEPEPRRARQQKPAPSIAAKAEPPRQLRGSRGGTPAPVASDFDLWSFRHEQESTASELDSGSRKHKRSHSWGGGKSGRPMGLMPGVAQYQQAMERKQRTAEKLEAIKQEKQRALLAECSFTPRLVSQLPWTAPKRAAAATAVEPATAAGERMYAEATEARRRWQLRLQKLQQEEEAERQLHAHRARPLSVAVYGRQAPKAEPHANPPHKDVGECTFKPATTPRRPQSAPGSRTPLDTLSVIAGLSGGEPAPAAPGSTMARGATPPRGRNLPKLGPMQTLRTKTAPAWGPPPAKPAQEPEDDAGGDDFKQTQSDFWRTAGSLSGFDGNGTKQPPTMKDLGLAVDLNFDEFITRQATFLQSKETKLKEQRKAKSRPASPTLSRGTQRLFMGSETKKPEEVAVDMKAAWTRKRQEQQLPPSFQPSLTLRGRHREGRTPAELSEGDRLRNVYHKERMRLDRLLLEAQDVTFSPVTNDYPGVGPSHQILHPETCAAFLRIRQKRHQEHLQAEERRKQVEEKAECTFTPHITKRVPSFISQIRRQRAGDLRQTRSA